MRDYAKVGGRKGLPGYRTPSVFRYRKSLEIKSAKHKAKNQAGFRDRALGGGKRYSQGEKGCD
jgi:hypothetical protein